MKVIAFNGSPHTDGVVARGIEIMGGELEKAGIALETIHVGNQEIRGCTDCKRCRELGQCVFSGDIVNECSRKMLEADGLILGSPVYFGGITGTFKCFLDRIFFPAPKTCYRVGASVVSLRRTGGIAVFHQLNNYLYLGQMIIVPTIYWDVIHGNSPEEFMEDEEGRQILEVQGRNMAWLLKAVTEGRKVVPPPKMPQRLRTNFIH